MKSSASLLVSISLLAVLSSCADRKEIPRTPKSGPALGAPTVPWDDKTREERMAFMAASVHPEMKKIFLEYDDSYEDFSCETCHGRDMELLDFELPNDLYALPADDPIQEAMDYDEELAQFMMGKVVPRLAQLFAKEAGKPGGVTCFTCHPKEE